VLRHHLSTFVFHQVEHRFSVFELSFFFSHIIASTSRKLFSSLPGHLVLFFDFLFLSRFLSGGFSIYFFLPILPLFCPFYMLLETFSIHCFFPCVDMSSNRAWHPHCRMPVRFLSYIPLFFIPPTAVNFPSLFPPRFFFLAVFSF